MKYLIDICLTSYDMRLNCLAELILSYFFIYLSRVVITILVHCIAVRTSRYCKYLVGKKKNSYFKKGLLCFFCQSLYRPTNLPVVALRDFKKTLFFLTLVF